MHSTFQRCCKGILILYAQTLKPNILHVCIIYHPLVFGAEGDLEANVGTPFISTLSFWNNSKNTINIQNKPSKVYIEHID
jgi:hypothetical protein